MSSSLVAYTAQCLAVQHLPAFSVGTGLQTLWCVWMSIVHRRLFLLLSLLLPPCLIAWYSFGFMWAIFSLYRLVIRLEISDEEVLDLVLFRPLGSSTCHFLRKFFWGTPVIYKRRGDVWRVEFTQHHNYSRPQANPNPNTYPNPN